MKLSKKARSNRRMVALLDADARKVVFERDGGVCVRCGDRSRAVQWCHIFSRRHKALRWEPDNALSMCAGCHMFWHHEPLLAVEWFRKKWPERYSRIMAVMQINPKVRVKEIYGVSGTSGAK